MTGGIAPMLGENAAAREAMLWKAFKTDGSASARASLFTEHFPFARQLARRRWMERWSGQVEFEDLCQLASTGLLEALDQYDPDQGVPFRGYAARRITGSMLDGIAKMSEVRQQISFRNRVRRERAKSLTASAGDGQSTEEALQALIDVVVGLAYGFMLEADGQHAVDAAQERVPNAYESLAWKETVGRLLSEVGSLPDREQAIIRHHYLNGLTFEQLGDLLGISKGRVSQLHREALARLRKRLGRPGEFKLQR